jgi:translocation and assembly module TamB
VSYGNGIASLINTQLTVAESGDITAVGQVDFTARQVNLTAAARLPLDEIAQQAAIAVPAGLILGTLTADVDAAGPLTAPLAEARWQLAEGSIPGQGLLTYTDQRLALRDTEFDVGGGILSAAGQADLRTGFWDVGVVGNRLGLGAVSPQLLGTADLALRASGSLADLSPAAMRASGDLAFSEGIPLAIADTNMLTEGSVLIDGPLQLAFDWDGSILGIPSLTAPGVMVSGQIATLPNADTGFPWPDTVDLTARITDYDLARLNAVSPLANYGVLLSGRFDFDGILQGSLEDPFLQGDLALRETALGSLALLSDVSGSLEASLNRGGQLNLLGEMTEIRAEVDAERLPVSLLFRNGPLLAMAQREGDWLRGQVRDFPLGALGIRPVQEPDLGVISGTLRSDFEVQLSTLYTNPTARVSYGINRPALGHFAATSLQGRLRLANGQAHLDNTFLDLPQSRFGIQAEMNVRSPRSATARITTRDAHIEDLLAALRLYEFADVRNFLTPRPWGTAADLQTTPIETAPGDLAGQLQRAAEASALQAQREADAERVLLPSLSALRGTFDADISLAASETDGVEAAFDIHGAACCEMRQAPLHHLGQ